MGRATHVANLPFAPFLQPDAQHGDVVGPDTQHLHRRGARLVAVRHRDGTAQHRQLVVAPLSGGAHKIHLFVLVAWMRQLQRQVAVVREQDQPLRILVQTPNRNEPLAHFPPEKVKHGLPAERIRHARQHTNRLVHHDCARSFGGDQRLPIHADAHALRIKPRTRLRADDTIHRHTSGGNDFR